MTIDNQDPNEELHQDDIPSGEHIPWQVTPAHGEDEMHVDYALYGVIKNE